MTSCTPARERTPVSVNPAASRHFAQAEATEKKKKKKEEESTDVRLLYFAPLRLIYGLPCRFIEGCRLRNERHWYTSPRKCRRPSPHSPLPLLPLIRDPATGRWTGGRAGSRPLSRKKEYLESRANSGEKYAPRRFHAFSRWIMHRWNGSLGAAQPEAAIANRPTSSRLFEPRLF